MTIELKKKEIKQLLEECDYVITQLDLINQTDKIRDMLANNTSMITIYYSNNLGCRFRGKLACYETKKIFIIEFDYDSIKRYY